MKKDNILKHQDNIKKFTLNKKIDNYKEFVNYIFNILNKEILDDIIYYTLIYIKYNDFIPNIKNGNLDKIYNMYNILLHKLEYDKLNIKERYIYEYITSFLIINEEFENNKFFDIYYKKYLNKINYNNFNKQIFLIHQYLINDLNKIYNKNYKLAFDNLEAKACTNWLNKEKKDKIYLNNDIYLAYFYNIVESNVDIKTKLVNEIFSILHEYKHLLQKDYMLNNNDYLSNQYKNDLYIICFRKKLYKKNHDDLFIEKEANEYALKNVGKYLSEYIEYSYFEKKDIEDKLKKIYNNPENKKIFLLQYKYLKYYLEFIKSAPLKLKKLKIFNEMIEERREEYGLKK